MREVRFIVVIIVWNCVWGLTGTPLLETEARITKIVVFAGTRHGGYTSAVRSLNR